MGNFVLQPSDSKVLNSIKAEKRAADEGDEAAISKRKQKKMEKNPNRKFPHARANCKICASCPNPAGQRCDYTLCKKCCRSKCYNEELDCSGHRILVKTKRELARARVAREAASAAGALTECDQKLPIVTRFDQSEEDTKKLVTELTEEVIT